ncbi:MAG: cytochrome C [Deltaproteobacteria bacterium]|nr:cytochrome C [Deltaproteobacteria bacterium]
MKSSKWIAGFIGIVLIILIIVLIGAFESNEGIRFGTATVALQDMVGPPSAEAREAASKAQMSPYQMEVKPLTTVECGQCHFSIFQTIKKEGARHQIDCVRCHREYHIYNPRKQNYDQIMPDCAWCHKSASGGAFHGDQKVLTPCLTCHIDPHKPLVIPMAEVEASCALCHTKEGGEIENFPSKHTSDVACADCHADKHGFIPECSVCHESHSPAVELATKDCMTCHPVHKPTQIAYDKTTESAICAGCHEDVNDLLQKKVTKHTAVTCADCHRSHAEIPACGMCHGEPHPKAMKATNCRDCHGIAHDLLM